MRKYTRWPASGQMKVSSNGLGASKYVATLDPQLCIHGDRLKGPLCHREAGYGPHSLLKPIASVIAELLILHIVALSRLALSSDCRCVVALV